MTPLAHRIVKELTLPQNQRSKDVGRIRDRMDDVHCFEVSEISEAAEAMSTRLLETGIDDELMFLPAPKTWIEFERIIEGRRFRIGYLMEEREGFVSVRQKLCLCSVGSPCA